MTEMPNRPAAAPPEARGPSDSSGMDDQARHRAEQARVIHTINEALSGPVLDVYRSVLPKLKPYSYQDVLASPDLVEGCMVFFEKQPDLFRHLLVDEAGHPVSDETQPLSCGRSIKDIRLLVIRTTAKKYFRTHGDKFGDVKEHSERDDSIVNAKMLDRLFDLVTRLWQGKPLKKPPQKKRKKQKSGADAFYETIAPFLRFRWQVKLIPYYATLPRSLVEELGEGLLRLRRPEDLESLLRIGREDFNEAQRMTGDLSREMLDTEPRAAKGVVHAGQHEYGRLLSSLHEHMGARFWKVFVETSRIDSLRSKNIADIVEMASHLDRMSPESVEGMVSHLERRQIAPFLRAAESVLDPKDFDAVFGIPGNPRLARIFMQKATMLKTDPNEPDDFENRLPVIFKAWRSSPEHFAKNL
ncbi:hypothetical protein [Rhodospira trueperi]|uniref:Uncharacterized protein n=1 Tax=Rhodospira trueperi TaxID=69960 RepID=A0A1G6X5M2_9PROT|nr:hypothetical protein [Rhodospira trueperi]SDD73364.1 hypothetical protein SAMN05421720_101377 [Rhodospira trueperi]